LEDVLLGFLFSTIRDSEKKDKRKYLLTDIFPSFPKLMRAKPVLLASIIT